MITFDAEKNEIRKEDDQLRCEICGRGDRCFYNQVTIKNEVKILCFECEAQI
jgi:hypothetical protein